MNASMTIAKLQIFKTGSFVLMMTVSKKKFKKEILASLDLHRLSMIVAWVSKGVSQIVFTLFSGYFMLIWDVF